MPQPSPKQAPFIALAPMEGVSNLPMRLWWHLTSAPTALATPFLRVTPTYPSSGLTRGFCPELGELRSYLPYSLVPQIMAADSADFVRSAPYFLGHAPFVELNAGCPSPTCVGKGAGSSLLRVSEEFHSFVGELTKELGAGTVAVKMRTGFQSDVEFQNLIDGLTDCSLARLTVHGRTRPERYTGQARWDLIAKASEQCGMPVVASGDVVDQASLTQRLAQAPRAAGVLVGRGALRNPWIFTELRTGQPVRLNFATLRYALMAHAMLHELFQEQTDALFELCKSGLFTASCGTDEERWRVVQAGLATALYGRGQVGPGPLARQTIGRLKMLWNYLRSSLPAVFFAPTVLRSPSLEVLLEHLQRINAEYAAAGGTDLPLRHHSGLDWMYSGEKHQNTGDS